MTAIAAWALALGVLWSAVLSFASDTAAAEPPTIEFMNPGPPSACGSKPRVSAITLPLGTALVIVNHINHEATMVVGSTAILEVSDGAAAELMLAPGQHEVRLVPDCVANRPINPLTVTITAPPEPADPSTGTSEAPTSTGTADAAAPPPAAGSSSPPRSTASSRPRPIASTDEALPVPAATISDATNQPSADTAPRPSASAGVAGVISARPVALSGEGHAKGLRLLAAVATICVLGVTVAIIRAIVRLSP